MRPFQNDCTHPKQHLNTFLSGMVRHLSRKFDFCKAISEPGQKYCSAYKKSVYINSVSQKNVSYPYVENKAYKMFRTPYFHEILNMFHTLEDDGPKCFIPSFRNPGNVSYPGTKHSNRVCRLKNEHPLNLKIVLKWKS